MNASFKSTLEIFDQTLLKTYTLLDEVKDETGFGNWANSYSVLKATLHSLRDALPLQEALHLGGQLPLLVRGIYYEDWSGTDGTPLGSVEDFYNSVVSKLNDPSIGPQIRPLLRAAIKSLSIHTSVGEMDTVLRHLPAGLFEVPGTKFFPGDGDTDSYRGILTYE